MTDSTLLTREPVVNRNRAITANRFVAHGPNVGAVVDMLNGLGETWPTRHSVFGSFSTLGPKNAWNIAPNVAVVAAIKPQAITSAKLKLRRDIFAAD